MKIDTVEEVWENLESNYRKSGKKSRREFLLGLTGFQGQKGAVQGLEAVLRSDLDDSSESITRYKALCKMLEMAEDWLIKNDSEISDLDFWLEQLGKSTQFDSSLIQTVYSPKTSDILLDNIKFGYVLPGLYDKMNKMTFETSMDGYIFLETMPDVVKKLPIILKAARHPDALFEQQVAHILNIGITERNLELPSLFIKKDILVAPIVKYHKKYKVDEKQVPVVAGASACVDLHYDYGLVELSVATSIPVYIIG